MRLFFITGLVAAVCAVQGAADPLPSWNDGAAKSAIISFVDEVTDPAGDSYVTPADRIAVFDNDGTLWAEQPVYFQLLYAMDKVKDADPADLTTDTLKAAAAGDIDAVLASGKEGLLEIVDFSHSGMSVEAFQRDVAAWVNTQTHPTTGLTYAGMTYQPMLELLSYLRDEGFSTYIVSGGGIDFIRAVAEDAYGITPPEVIGSQGKLTYEVGADGPVVLKEGGIVFVDDGPGKPVGIMRHIGKRPIFAGGNSDGDFQMLEWTTAGEGPRFGMLVHHTDGDRAFAYDREGHIGVLNDGLDEAGERGWVLVDMKDDWARIWSGD